MLPSTQPWWKRLPFAKCNSFLSLTSALPWFPVSFWSELYCFLALLKRHFYKKSTWLGSKQHARVIRAAGTSPSAWYGAAPAIHALALPLLVAQQTGEHSCGAGKRNSKQPRAWILLLFGAKAPWKVKLQPCLFLSKGSSAGKPSVRASWKGKWSQVTLLCCRVFTTPVQAQPSGSGHTHSPATVQPGPLVARHAVLTLSCLSWTRPGWRYPTSPSRGLPSSGEQIPARTAEAAKLKGLYGVGIWSQNCSLKEKKTMKHTTQHAQLHHFGVHFETQLQSLNRKSMFFCQQTLNTNCSSRLAQLKVCLGLKTCLLSTGVLLKIVIWKFQLKSKVLDRSTQWFSIQ